MLSGKPDPSFGLDPRAVHSCERSRLEQRERAAGDGSPCISDRRIFLPAHEDIRAAMPAPTTMTVFGRGVLSKPLRMMDRLPGWFTDDLLLRARNALRMLGSAS